MKKILIIEDDSFLQGLESTKLSKEGYQVSIASNGEEGIKKAVEETPDLILLDLMLPGIDGFTVLEKIKENSTLKTKPVIVFSNLSEESDLVRTRNLGANEFMIKASFTLEELLEKIKALLL